MRVFRWAWSLDGVGGEMTRPVVLVVPCLVDECTEGCLGVLTGAQEPFGGFALAAETPEELDVLELIRLVIGGERINPHQEIS